MEPDLWRIDRYRDFLEARKALLAAEANRCFADLLHGDSRWLSESGTQIEEPAPTVPGGIDSEAEETELKTLNDWLASRDLPRGHLAFDHADPATGAQTAVFDLAWPEGRQPGLTEPVAVLLNEPAEVLAIASAAGYRLLYLGGGVPCLCRKRSPQRRGRLSAGCPSRSWQPEPRAAKWRCALVRGAGFPGLIWLT